MNVLADPRFTLAPTIDEQLYTYQKKVDVAVEKLSSLLKLIDRKQSALSTLEKRLKELKYDSKNALFSEIKKQQVKLKTLKATGQTPRPQRQLGAWQTSEISPYSIIKEVQQIAMSRTRPISQQEQELLEEATQLVEKFQENTTQFMANDWKLFIEQVQKAGINWLAILE